MVPKPLDPIADVETLYSEVRAISSWLREHGYPDFGKELHQTLKDGGVSSLEVSGNIRLVMRKLVSRHELDDDEVISRMQCCISFVDFIWGDPARDDNPYA
jgi:hypothetical protein